MNSSNKTFYNSFCENFLHNFLEKYYKYTIVNNKKILFNDLQERCPFSIDVLDDILFIDTGDNSYSFKFNWEIRTLENNGGNSYYLTNITIIK